MILYIVGDEIFNISNFMLRNIILKHSQYLLMQFFAYW